MSGVDAPSCDDVLRDDALPAPAFQRAVLAALVAEPEIALIDARPFRARIRYDGAAYDILLDDLFRRYRHSELEIEDAADEIMAALGVPGARSVRRGPFPFLERRELTAPGVHVTPCAFDDTLAVLYIWALPSGHRPIARAEVDAGWPDGSLPSVALQALSDRTAAVPALREGEGSRLIFSYRTGDGLDAATILLPDLRAEMAGWVPGAPRFAIPHRDALIVFGAEDEAVVAHMRAVVAEMFEHASPAARLTPRLFGLGPDGELVAV